MVLKRCVDIFLQALGSKKTHKNYLYHLDNFLAWNKLTDYDDLDKEEGVPFYELKKDTKDDSDYYERQIYSFEDILYVRINLPKITHRKYELSQTKFVTSLNSQKLDTFCVN